MRYDKDGKYTVVEEGGGERREEERGFVYGGQVGRKEGRGKGKRPEEGDAMQAVKAIGKTGQGERKRGRDDESANVSSTA